MTASLGRGAVFFCALRGRDYTVTIGIVGISLYFFLVLVINP